MYHKLALEKVYTYICVWSKIAPQGSQTWRHSSSVYRLRKILSVEVKLRLCLVGGATIDFGQMLRLTIDKQGATSCCFEYLDKSST